MSIARPKPRHWWQVPQIDTKMAEASPSWVSSSSSESTYVYSLSCSDHDLLSVVGFDWSLLPDVIVIEIFKFLKDSDRSHLALTCKKFLELFKTPCLWRYRYFDFGTSRIAKNEQKSLGFAQHLGANLHILTIKCRHPSYSTCKRFQRVITNVLTLLGTQARLKKFDMSGLELDRYWRFEFTREKMLLSLSRFLRGQKMLVYVNMAAAMIQVNNGCRILEAIVHGSAKHINHLNIEDYFHSRQAVYRVDRFVNLIGKLTNLSELYINYNCLSDDIFRVLAKQNAKKLQFLSVKVYKSDPHFHKIDGFSWKSLTKSCPFLEVDFDFDQVSSYEEIIRTLVPQIPLKSLHIWTGYYSDDETWKINDIIAYISDHFKNKMVRLSLEIDNCPESIDESIKTMVVRCKSLTKLDINAVFSIDTVEDICQLQLDEKIKLQRFHATLCGLTDMQFSELSFLQDQYKPMIHGSNLDFKFTSDLIVGFDD